MQDYQMSLVIIASTKTVHQYCPEVLAYVPFMMLPYHMCQIICNKHLWHEFAIKLKQKAKRNSNASKTYSPV